MMNDDGSKSSFMMDVDSPVIQEEAKNSSTSISTSSNNKNDSPSSSNEKEPEKIIQMHPLAIIGMSDHYTRVMMDTITANENEKDSSSSSSSSCSKLMGLMYGTTNDNDTISIVDVEEIMLEDDDNSSHNNDSSSSKYASVQTKIELHQKVFPKHFVVGWYRMGDEQLEVDLQMSLEGWIQHFQKDPLFVWMDTYTTINTTINTTNDDCKEQSSSMEQPTTVVEEEEEDLPLNLYTLYNSSVFVQLELNLETFEPERIAMDAVVSSTQKQQRQRQRQQRHTTSQPPSEHTNTTNNTALLANESTTTVAEYQLQSIQSSMEAMNMRIAVLLEFLRKTQSGDIPTDYKLLREVNALIQQLSFVMNHNNNNNNTSSSFSNELDNELDNESNDMMILTYLATIAKTTKAVQQYSDKYLKVTVSTSVKPKSQWATHHQHHQHQQQQRHQHNQAEQSSSSNFRY